jgi:hypothetical protein
MDKPNRVNHRNVVQRRGVEDAGQERRRLDTRSYREAQGRRWLRRGEPSKRIEY